MFCFCFGTFSGLFVEGYPPAKLPEDLSFFDLRRKQKRAIPDDSSINLIFRHCSEKHFFVACAVNARDGKRDGFLGFGVSLIEPFFPKDIEEAIDWCYQSLLESDFIDSGKIIKSPIKSSGPMIDLSGLDTPADFEKFALVNFDWQNVANKKDIANEIALPLLEKLASFEVILNANAGAKISSVEELFPNATSERVQQTKDRVHNLRSSRGLETMQARTPQGFGLHENNSFMSKIITKLPIIIGSLAAVCLGIVVIAAVFWIYSTKPSNPNVVGEDKPRPISSLQTSMETNSVGVEQTQCGQDIEAKKKEEGNTSYFIVARDALDTTKLWNRDESKACKKVNYTAIKWFREEGVELDEFIYAGEQNNKYLKQLEDDIYLTSFSSLIDSWQFLRTSNTSGMSFDAEKFYQEFAFAISSNKDDSDGPQKQLICDAKFIKGLSKKYSFPEDIEIQYYSSSSNLFDKIVKETALNFRNFLANAMPGYSNTTLSKSRGDQLTGLAEYWLGYKQISKYKLGQPLENNCIFTVSALDQLNIQKRLLDDKSEKLDTLEFLRRLGGSEKNDYPPIKCKILPDKIIIWKQVNETNTNYEFDQTLNFRNINLSFTPIDSGKENLSWSFPIMVGEDLNIVKQLVGQLKSEDKQLFNILKKDEAICAQE